jgi:hypothetical protein
MPSGAGKTGLCGARENRDGTLWSLNYGMITRLSADPVEKKPLNRLPAGHEDAVGRFLWLQPFPALLPKLSVIQGNAPHPHPGSRAEWSIWLAGRVSLGGLSDL